MEERYKNQGKFESKSNYEKYAEKKQKKLLEKNSAASTVYIHAAGKRRSIQ